MPIYEYVVEDGDCNYCGGCFELRRPIDREPLTHCPLCQKAVRKIISAANTPKKLKPFSMSDAKQAGFKILERKDKGTYEQL